MKKILFSLLFLLLFLTGCAKEKVTDKQINIPMISQVKTIEKAGTYTGEVDKSGKPDGKGIFKSQNAKGVKWTYEGDFKNGTFEGKGTITFEDGIKTEANFHNGLENGRITQTENGKLFYDGDCKEGNKTGKAKLYNPKTGKLLYEGEVKNGSPNGNGKLYNEDGSVKFEGRYIMGIASSGEIGRDKSASASNWEYSISDIKTFKNIGKMQASGIYLILFVDAKNNGPVSNHLGENFFALIDDQGRIFDEARVKVLWEYEETMKNYNSNTWYTSVNPGITAKNIPVIFEIPEDCKNLWLLPKNESHKSKFIKVK